MAKKIYFKKFTKKVSWVAPFYATLIALIYSSSDSSEEQKSLKLSLICLLLFFQCIYTLLKTLGDNNFHLS